MRRIYSFLFLFLLCFFNLNAFEKTKIENDCIVDLQFSYFCPLSENFRVIYGSGGINYNLSLSIPIVKYLYLWESFDYFSKSGSSIHGKQRTEITLIPLTLGLKFMSSVGKYRWYVAGGGKYYFLTNRNHSSYVDENIKKRGLGGAVELGGSRVFAECLQLNLFFNYSFKHFKKNSTKITNVFTTGSEVGGIYVGGGLGYYF